MKAHRLVCVVDDDVDYVLILARIFDTHFPQYAVRFFSSAHEFLDQLSQLNRSPDLILLDEHMPGLDGHQTILLFKQHPTYVQTPIVVMSADASQDEVDACYQAGANSYVPKPDNLAELKNAMHIICQYWLDFSPKLQ